MKLYKNFVCLDKNSEILIDPDENFWNKDTKFISQCRHWNKCKLNTFVANKKDRGIN